LLGRLAQLVRALA